MAQPIGEFSERKLKNVTSLMETDNCENSFLEKNLCRMKMHVLNKSYAGRLGTCRMESKMAEKGNSMLKENVIF